MSLIIVEYTNIHTHQSNPVELLSFFLVFLKRHVEDIYTNFHTHAPEKVEKVKDTNIIADTDRQK